MASAQSPALLPDREDHAVVFELGWAGEWSHAEGFHPKGATFALEVTPIEKWLELEFGVTAVRADGVTESPVDVLFKKPRNAPWPGNRGRPSCWPLTIDGCASVCGTEIGALLRKVSASPDEDAVVLGPTQAGIPAIPS